MHKVIVNSTPLIVLCGIDRLNILKEMYQGIYIPSAVFREVTSKNDSACEQIRLFKDWIHVKQIQSFLMIMQRKRQLSIWDLKLQGH